MSFWKQFIKIFIPFVRVGFDVVEDLNELIFDDFERRIKVWVHEFFWEEDDSGFRIGLLVIP